MTTSRSQSLAILQGIWNDDPVAIEVDRWCRHEMQHGLPTRDSNEMILRQWRRVAGTDLEWRAFLA